MTNPIAQSRGHRCFRPDALPHAYRLSCSRTDLFSSFVIFFRWQGAKCTALPIGMNMISSLRWHMKNLWLPVLFSIAVTMAHAGCPPSAKTTGVHIARITYSNADRILSFTIQEAPNAGAMTLSKDSDLGSDFGKEIIALLLLAKSGNYPVELVCAAGNVSDLTVDVPS